MSSSASESSTESEDDDDEEDEEMEDDGQIESFRKRKHDTNKRLSGAKEETSAAFSATDSNSPAKKLKPKLVEKKEAVAEKNSEAKLTNNELSINPNHVNNTTVNSSITVATSNTTPTL